MAWQADCPTHDLVCSPRRLASSDHWTFSSWSRSKCRSKSNIASCVIMIFWGDNILPTWWKISRMHLYYLSTGVRMKLSSGAEPKLLDRRQGWGMCCCLYFILPRLSCSRTWHQKNVHYILLIVKQPTDLQECKRSTTFLVTRWRFRRVHWLQGVMWLWVILNGPKGVMWHRVTIQCPMGIMWLRVTLQCTKPTHLRRVTSCYLQRNRVWCNRCHVTIMWQRWPCHEIAKSIVCVRDCWK